jgi:hypothetical protein
LKRRDVMLKKSCLLVFLSVTLVSAANARSPATINLNEPGALEALQRDNPAHYQTVRQILDNILKQPESQVPRWLRTTFNANDVRYLRVLLTSDPPKRDLSFTLDDTQYKMRLTLAHDGVKIVPAK